MTPAGDELQDFIEFCDTLAGVSVQEAVRLFREHKNGGKARIPRTPLVRKLRKLRAEYIQAGGRLFTPEQVEQEVRHRRSEKGKDRD